MMGPVFVAILLIAIGAAVIWWRARKAERRHQLHYEEPPPAHISHHAEHAPSMAESTIQRLAREPFCAMERDGKYIDLTSDEIAQIFSPIAELLKSFRSDRARLSRIATTYDSAGKIDGFDRDYFTDLCNSARAGAERAQELLDACIFRNEKSANKYFDLIDGFYEVESDVNGLLDEIQTINDLIRDGDHPACKRPAQSKPTPRRRNPKPKL